MKYLVATDGSTESDHAVRYAVRHAVAIGAALEVVHVLTPETDLVDGQVVVPEEVRAIEQGQRTLDRAMELVERVADEQGRDLTVEGELLTGRPASAIAAHADEGGADAIYVGHRGLSEEREQVVGSVAKTLVDKATVPVTVIR